MDFFDDIYGNEKQKDFFRERIRQERLSHAYILEAPRGGGKKMLALRIAASLAGLEKKPEEERALASRRNQNGDSSDVRRLSRKEEGKKTRDFMTSVYLAPSELSFKMYLFDEADRITPQAQNALLKVIEEPWRGVYLFLLCENSLSLLATVRSRAQKISLQTFNEEELRGYAKEAGLPGADDSDRMNFAVRTAHGAIGRLRELLEDGGTEFLAYTAAKKAIAGQAEKGRGMTYYTFLASIGEAAQTRELFEAFVGYLLSAYGDLARAGFSEGYMPEFWTKDEIQTYAASISADTVTASFLAADAIRSDLRFNVNLSLSATRLAIALWNAA